MSADRAHSGEIPTESPPKGGAPGASTEPKHSIKPSVATSTSDRVAASTRSTITSLKLSSVGIEFALSVLIGVFASLDLVTLQGLNGRVQVGGEPAASVARDYLTRNGFIK